MAPSLLYQNAEAKLGDLRPKWADALNKMTLVDGPNSANQSGKDMVEIIQTDGIALRRALEI